MRKQPQLSKSQKRKLKKLEVCAYAEIWLPFVCFDAQALIRWLKCVLFTV